MLVIVHVTWSNLSAICLRNRIHVENERPALLCTESSVCQKICMERLELQHAAC